MKNIVPAIVLFSAPLFSYSQWNANTAINTPVCIQANDQQDMRIVTDTKGGAIMTWLDFRNDATQMSGDIFTQRIDNNGMAKWAANGVALCTDASDQAAPSMVEDGTGGAIIAWNDWRNGSRDIYAQKIDSNGVVQWAANGVAVVAKANHQQDAKLISDGAGGAIIVWQDSVSGPYDIYAQRISSAGSVMWTAGGVAICTAALTQVNPKIETDAAGGAIITWQDKRNGTDYDIYAQRVNASGAVQWTANGVAVCAAAGTQSNPKIEPDGAGGVYIGWQDKRNGTDYDIYAQRVNASGAIQWITNGFGVSIEPGSQSALDMASEGVNGVIFTWKDDRNGNFDIYFQRADPNGAMQFSLGGNSMPLAPYSQVNPNIVGDAAGGAIIVWQDSTSGGSWNVTAGRIDAAGVIQWTSPVGTAPGSQTNPKNVADGSGGSVFAWQDKRGIDFDIYAQHLIANGSSSSIHEQNFYVESKCFPNPFSSSAVIEVGSLITMRGDVRFFTTNVIGEKAELPFSVFQNNIHISRGGLPRGVYFYEIMLNEKIISNGKMIIAD